MGQRWTGTVTDAEANVTVYRKEYGDTDLLTITDSEDGVTSELYDTIGGRRVLTARIDALENELR